MSGHLTRHFDYLAHTKPLSAAQVVDEGIGTVFKGTISQGMEGQHMRPRQISYVDVVANAGTVGSGIIGAENSGIFRASYRHLQNPWDEMGFWLVGFPFIRRGCTRR